MALPMNAQGQLGCFGLTCYHHAYSDQIDGTSFFRKKMVKKVSGTRGHNHKLQRAKAAASMKNKCQKRK